MYNIRPLPGLEAACGFVPCFRDAAELHDHRERQFNFKFNIQIANAHSKFER
jgi:hypothetical protein